jgi:hypothetical protein
MSASAPAACNIAINCGPSRGFAAAHFGWIGLILCDAGFSDGLSRLLGPWGFLKDAAFRIGTSSWFIFAFVFLALIGIILPGLFALCVARGGDARAFRQRFSRMSAALIPLGLMAWIAFSLSFVMANASYIAVSLSDPLGLGWNLLGTADLAWQPVLTAGLGPAQILFLTGGVIGSARVAQKAAAESKISPAPAMIYCAAAAIALMWLLI